MLVTMFCNQNNNVKHVEYHNIIGTWQVGGPEAPLTQGMKTEYSM